MIVSTAAVKQTRVKCELCLSLSTMSAPSSWGHQLVFIDLVEVVLVLQVAEETQLTLLQVSWGVSNFENFGRLKYEREEKRWSNKTHTHIQTWRSAHSSVIV